MYDSYVECLVKRNSPAYAYIVTGALAILTAVFIVLSLTAGFLSLILMLAFGFFTYLSYRNTHVEFEYLFVGGELSVDRILGKAKRVKAYECTMEEIQLIAPSDSPALNDYSAASKTFDFSSREEGARTYTVVVRKNGITEKLILEPDSRLIQGFCQTSPRKVLQ